MFTRLFCFKHVLAILTTVMLAPSAQAVPITIGGAVPHQGLHIEDASSSLLGFGNRSAMNTINNSGMSGSNHDNGATMWDSAGSPSDLLPAFITYDFGKNYSLNAVGDSVAIWNENNTANRGARIVEVYVSPTENASGLVKLNTNGGGAQDSGGNFLFPAAPAANGYGGFTLDFAGVSNSAMLSDVRLIHFNIVTSHGNPPGGDHITGFSEVRFNGTLQSTPTAILKQAQAQVTVAAGGIGANPFANAVSSQLDGNRTAEKTRNKAGINAASLTVGAVEHDVNGNNQWLSAAAPSVGTPQFITWDINSGGASGIILDRIHVWNYSEAVSNLSSRGARDVQIWVSPTTSLGDLVMLDNLALGGDFEFPRAVEAGGYGFEIRFEDVINPLLLNNVRLVQFRITSNYTLTGNTDLVGIAEVEFYSTEEPYTQAVVPEPSTYALGLIGLVGLGLAAWRKRARNGAQ